MLLFGYKAILIPKKSVFFLTLRRPNDRFSGDFKIRRIWNSPDFGEIIDNVYLSCLLRVLVFYEIEMFCYLINILSHVCTEL